MTEPARKHVDSTEERLERIERLLEELVRRKRAGKRAGTKRGRSVAERAAAGLQYRPNEIQIAAASRALARKR